MPTLEQVALETVRILTQAHREPPKFGGSAATRPRAVPTPPPPPDLEMQHSWNVNGPLEVGDDLDGRHNWGFVGTENFVVFRRELQGAGGTTTLQLRRGGVPIASASFTPAEGDHVEKAVALGGAFLASTQYSFHVTAIETTSGIGVNQLPAGASAALDVTRTA